MSLIKSYEEDGYLVEEYDNGTISKTLISDVTQEEIEVIGLSEQQLFNMVILNKLEYIECLEEINKGGL